MKKIIFAFVLLITSLTLIACNSSNEEYDIVASMYTHYDLSKAIVGDEMSVKLLVPTGEGIHGFEATSKDMVDIENAKLFLFTSLDIDTWIADENDIGGDDTLVVNLSEAIESHKHDHEDEADHEEDTDDDHGHSHSEDAHYWVDPMNAVAIAESILDAVITIDPDNESLYRTNTETVINEITTVSEAFETLLATHDDLPTIYVAGHNAFSLLGEHFGLDIESIFDEYEPDAVLDSSELIPFVEAVIDAETEYLFIEALEAPTAANRIKEYLEDNYDYDLTILKLYAYQNVNQDDYDAQVTYTELLQRNIDNLKLALGV